MYAFVGFIYGGMQYIHNRMEGTTSIRVRKATVEQLKDLGGMRDSLDTVIQRLVKESKEKHKK